MREAQCKENFKVVEEGIRHASRFSEFHDLNARYHMIQEEMGMQKKDLIQDSKIEADVAAFS
ncbi:hypothetical protein ERO13_D13G211001v2 [Gossypium hirsutum]|nr:hypothetical protein ERO13_D13G211001v2 [Gossypium hirsutum]